MARVPRHLLHVQDNTPNQSINNMKKLLLTLLLLLSLGFAASAATELELFNVTANTSFSSTGSASTTESTLTVNGYDFKVMNVWWQKNATNSYFAFKKATPAGYMILPVFADKKITKMSLYLPSGLTKNTKFDVYANNVKIGATITWTAAGAWQDFEIPAENQAAGTEYKIQSANTGNQIGLGRLKIFYEEAGQKETIELSEDNILIEDHNGQSLVGGASYEYEAGAKINFNYSYTGEVANPEINYSYSVNDGEAVEGNEYTYDGNGDVTLKMMVTSGENSVSKTITILKKYPTVCPDPVFSVANNADVTAGQVIKVSCEGAKNLTWTVNGTPIEGDSYTVTEEPGTQLNFEAKATIDGRLASGELGELSSTATLVVNVIEATEATFTFAGENGSGYGLTLISDGGKYESDMTNPVTEISSGIAKVSFTGNYRYWNGDKTLRIMSGATFTISVPEDYYIESIDFNGTSSAATPDYGTLSSGNWINGGTQKSAVKFTRGSSGKVELKAITVKYAKLVPTLALSRVEITHGKVAGVVTIDYTFEIANHNGNPVDVTAAINGMDHIVFEKVETPAAAPARAAGENAVISGTLKATHADLKGAPSLNINVKATLDGKDLYNENHTEYATTGIEDVTVEGGEAAEYFNLQGIRVAKPQAGQVYIVRRGAKTTKDLVK